MSWDNESVIKLIEAYKKKEVLWDPKNKNYFNRLLKADAWDELEAELERPLEQIKKKMEYLLAALRREKQKMIKSKTTGQGTNDVYRSSWFAYPHMLFPLDRNKPRNRLNTESSTEDDGDEEVLDNRSPEESPAEEIVNQVLENESPRNEVHGNELPDTPDSQPGGSQVTVMQEPRSQASAAVKFKHPVPMKKAKKSASQKDPILNEALQLMRSSAQAATANLASTTLSPGIAPDRYQIYANYLASKFRTYSATTFMTVENHINNILFSADRGQYDWERERYETDSNSSRTSTPAPNMNVMNCGNVASDSNSSRTSTPAPNMNVMNCGNVASDSNSSRTSTPAPNMNVMNCGNVASDDDFSDLITFHNL
ncbi:hypothetical protein O0L34_g3651 [Tuta absoluta]|nr:hypothetical protein O0L34_g3651 [Tuta absoluta]